MRLHRSRSLPRPVPALRLLVVLPTLYRDSLWSEVGDCSQEEREEEAVDSVGESSSRLWF